MTDIFHSHKSSIYKNTNFILLMLPGIVFVFVLTTYILFFPRHEKGQVAAAKTKTVTEEKEKLNEDIYLERKLDNLQDR